MPWTEFKNWNLFRLLHFSLETRCLQTPFPSGASFRSPIRHLCPIRWQKQLFAAKSRTQSRRGTLPCLVCSNICPMIYATHFHRACIPFATHATKWSPCIPMSSIQTLRRSVNNYNYFSGSIGMHYTEYIHRHPLRTRIYFLRRMGRKRNELEWYVLKNVIIERLLERKQTFFDDCVINFHISRFVDILFV